MDKFKNISIKRAKPPVQNPAPEDVSLDDFLGEMSFKDTLGNFFADESDIQAVCDTLEKMGLPVPETRSEVVSGAAGVLLFSNDHGVALRIEREIAEEDKGSKDFFTNANGITRIDNSTWVLRPLATFQAGNVKIEICPGCHFESQESYVSGIAKELEKEGVNFWDRGARNIGLLPLKDEAFPRGFPVVIDRGAVSLLTKETTQVAALLDADDPQEILYGDLKQAFREAWPEGQKDPDTQKMQACWSMCRDYVAQGKLVAGWNEWENPKSRYEDKFPKTSEAQRAAAKYTARMKSQPRQKPAVKKGFTR